MEKTFFILVLIFSTIAANAQAPGTTDVKTKAIHTPIKVSELQKAITDNIAKDYAGFTIREATRVTKKDVVTYNVVIGKGTDLQTLVYDKDGKFVKIKAPKESTKKKK
jgi:hypothetical protein